ncbi:hypothetical protein AS156_14090 [Bradyrhizobium macuxiense]|uniref:Uncharacterized protein n=1 Tax=Bradyrhizobium macuxiense TaxID=1755647 RepID=A0A109JKU6_9BRAD|nr:hypothetical protein [Bradyrhizobium macuxiense]KWV50634.1 hypothetical protein AS156_14090 [Bradyrhizobium macuxiense]
MFELVVAGVILLAVGYWATMFAVGRRDDVLHGHFVEEAPDHEPVLSRPSLPPARAASSPPQSNKDSLQSRLAVIKRDLKDAAQS